MTHAWIGIVLATGCYGGVEYEWQARAVIAVEPQHVAAATLGAAGLTATWLSVRTDDLDVTYPVHVDGTELMLDSAFDGGALAVTYDPYYAAGVQRPRPGSLAIPLAGPYPPPPASEWPTDVPFNAKFELSLLGGPEPVRVPVLVAPAFDPCAYMDPAASGEPYAPIPANASPLTATCLDGTPCVVPGAPFAQDATTVIVPPFVIRIFIQAACSESIG